VLETIMSKYSEKSQTLWPGPAPKEASNEPVPERRTAQRFPFTAAAEVLDLRSKARVTGRSSDLGLGGCYIDTLAPLAVGAAVRIRLERGLLYFEAEGTVTYALVSMGMGLSFRSFEPKDHAVLKQWIAELSGEEATTAEPASQTPEESMLATIASNRQVLNELINLMIRKKIIGENEGSSLLRLMFR
jgi:PilZ domain